MTFDPTLTCQDVGNPKNDPLFKTWVRYCISQHSYLCKYTWELGEFDILLKDKKYRTYYNSLCGFPEKTIAVDHLLAQDSVQSGPQLTVHSR
jgi:hypothetical protein